MVSLMATDLERLTVQFEASTVKFEKALARIEGRSVASAKKVEKTFASMQQRMDASFSAVGSKLGGALALAGIGVSTQQVLQYADAWTKAQNSLKVAGLSGAALASTLDAIYAAAQRQGAPLEALTTLYGRLAQSQKELGASTPELIRFTEDVATALRVAGTSPEEASGALLQLAQALGSARVQAEEFNSVNDGARPVLQAVANGIEEAGGSVSKLKQLVNDGAISNVAFFKGFQAGVQTIRDQAAEAEPTIGQAFTRISNAIIKLVGEIDAAAGFSRSFVAELENIAKGMSDLVQPIMFVVDALKMLKDLQDYVSANGLNLGSKINQAVFGTDTLEEFVAPAEGPGVGPPTRNTRRSQQPAPIKAADYPVVGAKAKAAPKARADDLARETEQIRERTAALELEAQTMGKSTFEVEKARAAHDLLNAAKAAGKAITPELTAQIDKEAEAYARAAEKVEAAREAQRAMQEVQDGLASAFSGAASAIAKGEDAIDALTSSLTRLMDQLLDMIAQQLFKQLLGGINLGFAGGGTVGGTSGASYIRAATGGAIRGPGSGTSDSIPAMLSNGEFVVRAQAARKFAPLLEAINSGRLRLPHFATGGSVGPGLAAPGGARGGLAVQVVNQTGVPAAGRAEVTKGPNGQQLVRIVLGAVKKDAASGGLDQPMVGRYALKPTPVRRG